MTSAFFTTDEATLFSLSESPKASPQISRKDVIDKYEIERTVKWIEDGKFNRVALQFPDELLNVSCDVQSCLKERLGQQSIYILADTYYGSCCVDEVAAEHCKAEAVVHYGRTCLSPTSRLPLLYLFGRNDLNIQDCSEKFKTTYADVSEKIAVIYDVTYSHLAAALKSELSDYNNLKISELRIPESNLDNEAERVNSYHKLGRTFSLKPEENLEGYAFFYIGEESLFLCNFILTMNKCSFHSYNPVTKECRKEGATINKKLMKRYFYVEKAKDASTVGVLVGTLGIKDYLKTIDSLKSAIKQAGKKSYTFVVGKLNVPKLANFPEVDVFVLVSCPENSLIDSSEFFKPVVTPFEMELACNQAREWTGEYVIDFRELLPGGEHHVEMPEETEARMDVSLITGSVRQIGISSTDTVKTSDALMSRDSNMQVANAAGEFYADRSWKGLEPQLGQTPVTKAMQGTKGIAVGYESEPPSADPRNS